MSVGYRRTLVGRTGAVLGFLCGVIGLLAGLTQHTWKLGAMGWFSGGVLLVLLAVFVLADGAFAFLKPRILELPKT